jgi:MbtH protein
MQEDDDSRLYAAVRNSEEQYSIWPLDLPVPAGWMTTGFTGSRQACLSHVQEVWTDMRPLSVRTAGLSRSGAGA